MSKIEKFNHDSAVIGYREDGSGRPIMLIHGTGGDGAANFDGLMPYLSDKRVLRPDYAGSGLTEDPTGVLTLDHLVAQIVAAADHARLGVFDLVGFSLGSAVATRLAAHHPDRVEKLVLIGGFISGSDPRSQLQFQHWAHLARTAPDALARLMLLTGFSHDFLSKVDDFEAVVSNMVEAGNWEGLAKQAELDLKVDISGDLGSVNAGTLVVGNRYDQMVDPAASKAIADGIDGALLSWIEGPHLALMETPDAAGALIQRHLAV